MTANANVATESPFAGITDANAALAEGNRLLDENDTQMAIEAYKQAVLLDPDLAEAHFKLGISYALLEMQMEQSGAADSRHRQTRRKAAKRRIPNAPLKKLSRLIKSGSPPILMTTLPTIISAGPTPS